MRRTLKKALATVLSAAVICSSAVPMNVLAGTSEVICPCNEAHTATYHEAEVGVNCQTPGKIAYYECTTCGNVDNTLTDLTGEYGAHNMTHHEAEAGADCQTAGTIEYWSCDGCGKNFSDQAGTTELSEAEMNNGAVGAHKAVKTEAKAATETEAGNIEYWHCSECDKYFSDEALTKEITAADTVIPATGNEEGKFATVDGYDFYKDAEGNITCVDASGEMVVNKFMSDGEYTYFFQADGTAMKDKLSYHPEKNAPIYFDADGHMVIDEFVCVDSYTYFFQADGTAMLNRLTYHPDGKQIIYFDEYGHEVFDNFVHVKRSIAGEEVDDLCYFDTFGNMYVDVMTYDIAGENLYYVNPYGVMEQGKWFEFSDTCVWAGTTNKVGKGYGYANEDGTLLFNTYTYDWLGRYVYMQGNGHIL